MPREARLAALARAARYPAGAAAASRPRSYPGRSEIVPATLDPSVAFIGSDPWGGAVGTGVLVPSTPTASLVPAGTPPSQSRYLFLLARAQFAGGESGARLTGIRLYAELAGSVTVDGVTSSFRKEIVSPLWHPPDGNISWHVTVVPKTWRLTRNVQNADTLMFRDSYGPALLYEEVAGPPLAPTQYQPPNGGRPWGKPLAQGSLGSMHDLRYRWRTGYLEEMLDIAVPLPSDVCLFASVRQNDVATNPSASLLSAQQFAALGPEDQFLTAYSATAQYGRVAGSLVFSQDPVLPEEDP